MSTKTLPGLSKELIEALNALYPERCPDPAWTDREIWIEVGKRSVIRLLINKFNEQVKAAIENKTKV